MQYKPFPMLTRKLKGRQKEEFPLNEKFDTKSITVKNFRDKKSLYRKAVNLSEKGVVILWIENTVNEAFETYDKLSELSQKNLGILHSRFTAYDRSITEKACIKKLGGDDRSGYILVSTQVCEQSLDIDADVLFSSLAPSDMMIQRLGRLWRHRYNDKGRKVKEPSLYWFAPDLREKSQKLKTEKKIWAIQKFWRSSYVYELFILLRTFDIWVNFGEIKLPQDTRSIIEKTYEPNSNYPILFDAMTKRIKGMRSLSNIATNPYSAFEQESSINDDRILGSRLDGHTENVCLLNEKGNSIHGGQVSKDKKNKLNVSRAIVPLPKKTISDKLENIKKKELYYPSIGMKEMQGGYWVPLSPTTGNIIKGCLYSAKKGWQEK